MSPKWIPVLLSAWIGPIVRLVVWHLRELRTRIDFYMVASGGGDKVLFLRDDGIAHRGVMFATEDHSPFELYVYYIARNHLAGRTESAGTFLRKADKHVRWTYGWCRDSEKALLVADALR